MSAPLDLIGTLSAAAGEELRWDRVIILYNVGPLRPFAPIPPGSLGDRGCNALILGRAGEPRLYCKLRPETNAAFAHEAAIVERLGRRAESLVPPTRVITVAGLRVTASEYREGMTLCRSFGRFGDDGWHGAAAEVLARLNDLLASELQGPGVPTAPLERPAYSLEDDLETLVAHGRADPVVRGLARVARAGGPLPPAIQHGDLWCGNILLGPGGWTVVDFEWCGRVDSPLHDVFHLLRTCWDWRPGAANAGPAAWVEELRANAPGSIATRRIIADQAGRHRLEPAQVEAAFVHYAVEMATRLVRHGVSDQRWGGFVREVEAAARLADHGELTAALLGDGAIVAGRADAGSASSGRTL